MGRLHALLCAAALAALVPGPARAQPASREATAADEEVLRTAGVGVDGPDLLKYFRDRTFSAANPRRMATLIRELGSDAFIVREKAYADILRVGGPALFALRQAQDVPDTEVRCRVGALRRCLEDRPDPVVQAATARLVAARKPAGAAEVLLAYLPFAADDGVADEIRTALAAVAMRDRKPEPVVVRAL